MSTATKLSKLLATKEAQRIGLDIGSTAQFADYINYATKFNPSMLFDGGAKGTFYDHSDLSVLFKDELGKAQVTANNNSVGLLLDKSKRLEQREDLLRYGFKTVDGSWTANANGSYTLDTVGKSDSYLAGFKNGGVVLGSYYKVTLDTQYAADTINSSTFGYIFTDTYNTGVLQNGIATLTVKADSLDDVRFRIRGRPNNKLTLTVTAREITGNHATQAVVASMPKYQSVSGKGWLYYDNTNKKMTVKLVAMTATTVIATDDGVAINYPVTITAGDYELSKTSALGREYGRLIIDRELTAAEKAKVTQFFNDKRVV